MEIHDRSSIWLSLYFSVFSFSNCFNSFKISMGKFRFFSFFIKKINKINLLFIIVLTLGIKIEYFEMTFFFLTREKAAGTSKPWVSKHKKYK